MSAAHDDGGGHPAELIRLSCSCRLLGDATDHTFVHTGQNTGPDLHDQFLDELAIRDPDVQLALPAGSDRASPPCSPRSTPSSPRWPQRLVILGDTDSGMCAYAAARRHPGRAPRGRQPGARPPRTRGDQPASSTTCRRCCCPTPSPAPATCAERAWPRTIASS
ncbi:MAG: hypothetical protein R2690_11675 [Acidimicrobiales bacterium]